MRDEARFTEHETGNIHRPYFIMELRLTLWQELLISAAMMLVLILIVVHFNVPNPNMILIAGLVVSAALFGYNGGLLAGALMLVYSMYFFSTGHSYVHYTTLNFEKLIVILIGIVVVLLFVCELKRSSMRAFNEIDDLTQRLQEDNMLLKELSLNDALTGIRNRLALRHDFNAYIGRDLYVVMLDVDNFKGINDHYGHDQGDRILRVTGRNLAEQFGQEHCYRYGGDEFLMILPNVSETAVRSQINSIFELSPPLDKNHPDTRAGYSVGYVAGHAADDRALRRLFSVADERMYAVKRAGKNHINGDPVPV